MKILLIFASTISLLSILSLSGCGQSGPLYLPNAPTKKPTNTTKRTLKTQHEKNT